MKKKQLLFSRPSLFMALALSFAVSFYGCSEAEEFVEDQTEIEGDGDGVIPDGNIDPQFTLPSTEGSTKAPFDESPKPTRTVTSVWDGTTATRPPITRFDEQTRTMTVETAAELAWISDEVRAGNTLEGYIITLNAHIDLGGHIWKPIGTSKGTGTTKCSKYKTPKSQLLPFKGHFNGAKFEISNLNVAGEKHVGLFGYIEGASCAIINTVVTSGTVTGTIFAGGICGEVGDYGRIVHCDNGARVEGKECIGGITGASTKGVIYNCHNTNSIVATNNYIGGICGSSEATTIEICTNSGNITALTSQYVGGICGQGESVCVGCERVSSNIITSTNSGTVTGLSDVGGIYGHMNYSNAMGCINRGTVTGTTSIGGIVGCMYKECGLIRCDNEATATVTGSKYTGGICGYLKDHVVMNGCSNRADVTGGEDTGGIAGRQYCYTAVRASCNRGAVNGNKNTGGVTGYSYRSAQTAAYSRGDISGVTNVGGVLGFLGDNSQLYACYSTGNVTSSAAKPKVGGVTGESNANAKYSGAYWTGVTYAMGTDRKRDVTIFSSSTWPSVGTNNGQDPEWGIGDGTGSGKYWKTLGGYPTSYPLLYFEQEPPI